MEGHTATAISIHMGLNRVDPGHSQGWDGKLAELRSYNALRVPADYFDEAMGRLR
jgi:hypothetical protein